MQLDFRSDNVTPAAPEILEALVAANHGPAAPYGEDELTRRLEAVARQVFEADLAILPVTTGSAANGLALSVLAPPYGAVYCHDHGHIMVDECGGPELFTGGAKLIGLPSPDGKLRPEQLTEPVAEARAMGVHHVRPAVLSLTQATEWGTVYRPAEVAGLAEAAHAHGLKVHMDGARFANAVASLGCSPADVTWRAGVDILCLGATKNGALAAEAVILFDPSLAEDLAYRRKRAGHLWSKGRFLSVQLRAYLENGVWLRHAAHANAMARRLGDGLARLPDVSLAQPVEANEVFVAMPEPMVERLQRAGCRFHRWTTAADGVRPVLRLVASFATETRQVDAVLAAAAG